MSKCCDYLTRFSHIHAYEVHKLGLCLEFLYNCVDLSLIVRLLTYIKIYYLYSTHFLKTFTKGLTLKITKLSYAVITALGATALSTSLMAQTNEQGENQAKKIETIDRKVEIVGTGIIYIKLPQLVETFFHQFSC